MSFQMASRVFIVSLVILGLAIVIGYYYPRELKLAGFSPLSSIFSYVSILRTVVKRNSEKADREPIPPDDISAGACERIFTPAELALSKESPILLALMGKVFDVTKGARHYGPDGGYHFFAGRDASRAFVTGEFTESGLVADIAGLKPSEALEVQTWLKFYEDEYTYVGKLQGTYYDAAGKPTEKLRAAHQLIVEGEKEKAASDADKKRFPPCNSEWNQKAGTRIWCSNRSGGIAREWTGVPRRYFKPGAKNFRCACVPQHELSNPHFKLYEECDPNAVSCKLLKKNV